MTANEIAAAFVGGPMTAIRVQKLVQLCQRARVPLDEVLAVLPPETRDQVEALR